LCGWWRMRAIGIDDASEMWCPFARGAIDDALAGNRNYDGEPLRSCKCLTIDCMAWEFVDDNINEGFCALMGSFIQEEGSPKGNHVLRVLK
jgi:hypothetical protein